jgi:hypothetical protein
MTGCKFEKKSEFLGLRVRESTKIALQKASMQHDRPVGWVVERILRKYFKLDDK